MMCKTCKGAADLLAEAKQGGRDGNPGTRGFVRELHSECDDPNTCTCQHRIEKSEEEIRRDRNVALVG